MTIRHAAALALVGWCLMVPRPHSRAEQYQKKNGPTLTRAPARSRLVKGGQTQSTPLAIKFARERPSPLSSRALSDPPPYGTLRLGVSLFAVAANGVRFPASKLVSLASLLNWNWLSETK